MKTKRAALVLRKTAIRTAREWTVREHAPNIHQIEWRHCCSDFRSGLFVATDVHWDHPKCDRATLRAHLDEALELNRPVLIPGDFFCAMQGKFDKRGSKSDIRPEHNQKNYFNRLVDTAAQWLLPYASVIALISPGNHETAVSKQHEIDLCKMLVEKLRLLCPSSPVKLGGFSGWLRLQFAINGTQRQSLRLWYHHGYGGGGPVTRGVIQSNRQAVYVLADIIVSGHTHDAWVVPIQQIALTVGNVQRHQQQLHIRTPGYKDEYGSGSGGWHIERGGPPKPIGGAWVDLIYDVRRVYAEARLALRRAA